MMEVNLDYAINPEFAKKWSAYVLSYDKNDKNRYDVKILRQRFAELNNGYWLADKPLERRWVFVFRTNEDLTLFLLKDYNAYQP